MQIHYTGKNLEVTPALKEITQEKFNRLIHRHKNIKTVYIVFQVENLTHHAEVTVHLDGVDFHASAKADDMYQAVDLLIDKLSSQLIKHKDRTKDHH